MLFDAHTLALVARWSLYAGFVAVTLIHYKALEVTVSSAITRAIGALLGATLGYIYLLRADLADEPVALVVRPVHNRTSCQQALRVEALACDHAWPFASSLNVSFLSGFVLAMQQ